METERTPIRIAHCAKTYQDGTRGLQPTSLHIRAGEILALLGPSGCGKTTLLRMIAGLETPDIGSEIYFGDQDVTRIPIEQRQVGMMFQHYALFPQMTVEANIAYGLRIRGIEAKERDRIVGELIEMVHLQGREKKRPAELSGGQRQRVALARAIAVRPKVLLLDEPLTALDAKLKITLRDEMAELLRQLGITTVHVTHDQHEAFAIADRLAIMHAGEIVQIGDAETLYRAPSHPFVAEFLGTVNKLGRDEEAIRANILQLGSHTITCPDYCAQHTELMVRPEDIQIDQDDIQHTNAKVIRRTFLGERVQLAVELDGKRHATQLLAYIHRDSPWQTGDRVRVTINPQRLFTTAHTLL